MCAHNLSGHDIIGGQAIRTPYTCIYGDKHTSARKEIQISPPNLSEGGSLRLPIITTIFLKTHYVMQGWINHSRSGNIVINNVVFM